MNFLTRWQTWWDTAREENKFHCDIVLHPGEWVLMTAYGPDGEVVKEQWIGSGLVYTKVHLAASWEQRATEDAYGER